MFGQSSWPRRVLLFVVVLTLPVGNGTTLGRSQVVGPTQPRPILTGHWKLDTGETVTLTQDADGQVTAKFSPIVPCWDLPREFLFSGRLKTIPSDDTGFWLAGWDPPATVTLEDGRFWACTRNQRMWRECKVPKLFETKFRASVTGYGITGENLRPGYWVPGGNFASCRKDPAYDQWVPFSLTLLCRPATPWFNDSSCDADAWHALVSVDQTDETRHRVAVQVCGVNIFTAVDHPDYITEGYVALLWNTVRSQIPRPVCCAKFREAVRTGRPCNPSVDVDCDGIPNQSDVGIYPQLAYTYVGVPLIETFSVPVGGSVARFPEWLNPTDPAFVPGSTGAASCDCKWELIRGALKCGTGSQQHSYVATWRCPTSGAQVTTTKQGLAGSACP